MGATDTRSLRDVGEAVGAIKAKDGGKLEELVKKDAKEDGEKNGAKLYKDNDGDTFAVKDDVLIVGGDRKALEQALEQRDGDDRLKEDAFNEGLDGLPENSLVRVYGDLQAIIRQDPETRDARKVKWVDALRTLGLTLAVKNNAIDMDFNAKTEGEVTEEDLPVASGGQAPKVIKQAGELSFGVRDPSQIVTFFEAAMQAVEPQTFADYETGKQAISQRLGVDLEEDVFGQLTEDMSVSLAVNGSFGARAEVKSPDAFAGTVEKLADVLPELGSGLGVTAVRRNGDLYEAQLADGGRFFFGMENDVFVAASDPARARALGSEDPRSVEGAEGSLVMAADAEQVALQLIEQLGPQLGLGGLFGGGLFARPLDELSGSVSSSTDGMRGNFRLTLD